MRNIICSVRETIQLCVCVLNKPSLLPTFPRGFKAVKDINPLDVVGERGVGQQRPVPVDGV